MNIFEEFKEKVKQSSSIVDVISEARPLKNNKAICPFHTEETPSFSVNPKGQYCHCFGCGFSGDVITFVMHFYHKNYVEAVNFLANRAGIPALEIKPEDIAKLEEDKKVQDILNETVDFYQQSLKDQPRQYLLNRGFTDETIDRFRLGYSAGGLREHLLNTKGYSKELCLRAKVLMESNDSVLKDRFYKRIIIPNLKRGQVVNISNHPGQAPGPLFWIQRNRDTFIFPVKWSISSMKTRSRNKKQFSWPRELLIA